MGINIIFVLSSLVILRFTCSLVVSIILAVVINIRVWKFSYYCLGSSSLCSRFECLTSILCMYLPFFFNTFQCFDFHLRARDTLNIITFFIFPSTESRVVMNALYHDSSLRFLFVLRKYLTAVLLPCPTFLCSLDFWSSLHTLYPGLQLSRCYISEPFVISFSLIYRELSSLWHPEVNYNRHCLLSPSSPPRVRRIFFPSQDTRTACGCWQGTTTSSAPPTGSGKT